MGMPPRSRAGQTGAWGAGARPAVVWPHVPHLLGAVPSCFPSYSQLMDQTGPARGEHSSLGSGCSSAEGDRGVEPALVAKT